MISSEVQRTLVKSPPELWTELSHPDSLARHLGELGEIRITRTEPENLVEWEAQGTTGTVEIAPSGWGTRVKLTVARELPDAAPHEEESETALEDEAPTPSSETAAEDSAPTPTSETAAEDSAPTPTSETAAEGEAPAPLSETAAEDDDGAAALDAPTAPPGVPEAEAAAEHFLQHSGAAAAHVPPDTSIEAPIADRKPAPATEAARRAAGWPAGRQAPGPAIESDLRAAEALEGAPAEPDGLRDWASQAMESDALNLHADEVSEEHSAQEPAPPRRGFLARLFGRRRGRASKDQRSDETALRPEDIDDPETTLADAPTSQAADEPCEPDEPEPQVQESEPEEPEMAESELEHRAQDDSEIEEADLATLGVPEPSAEKVTAHEPDRASAEDEPEIEVAGPRAISGPEPGAGMEHEPAGSTAADADLPPHTAAQAPHPADAPESPADVAAELRAAEEVEAVLTAVLDRLGSAHHRPFSRP